MNISNNLNMLAAWSFRIVLALTRFSVQLIFYFYERCQDLVEWINFRVEAHFLKPEYIKTGNCNMTGQCCRAIGMEFPSSWKDKPRTLLWTQRWHSLRYNFKRVGLHENLIIYECRYLRDNRCSIQRFKPKLCRDFPHQPWRGKISLHKGCGYRYVPRSVHEFKHRLHGNSTVNPLANSARDDVQNEKSTQAISLQALRSELPSQYDK